MKKIIRLLIALLIVCASAAGCGGNEDPAAVDIATQTAEPTPEVTSTPVATPEIMPTPVQIYAEKVAEAQEKNPDVIGWIQIPGTNIDYPIMNSRQYELSSGGTTYYYNDHNVEMEKASSGAVYTMVSKISQNIVVTAHNSRVSGTMFHELHHIYDYNKGESICTYRKCDDELTSALPKLGADSPWTITVSYLEEEHTYQLFSIYHTEAGCDIYATLYDNVWWPGEGKRNYTKNTTEKVQAWINKQLKNSEIDLGVTVTTEDNFLTLYTCGTEKADSDRNARLYFFFKAID